MSEVDEVYKIGDSSADHCVEPSEPVVRRFPWRVCLLGLLRLAISVMYLRCGAVQLVVMSDKTTTSGQPAKFRYRYLKYYHGQDLVPLLTMSLTEAPGLALISAVSAVGLLTAVAVDYLGNLLGYQRSYEEVTKRRSSWSQVFLVVVMLTVFGLLSAAVDIVANICGTLSHAHHLFVRLGLAECAAFLILATGVNGILLYLWFGGLQFQNELITH